MKKVLLTLTLAAAMLTGCGGKSETSVSENAVIYSDTIINTYDKGRIFGKEPASYIDYETMDTTVLCARPNCSHTTSECAGVIIGDCPIIYKDYIYYFKSSNKVEELGDGQRELKIDSKLCRMSSATSVEETITTFNDCQPRDYDGWMIYNDKAYFTGDDLNPQEDSYGNISYGNTGGTHFFCTIDLKTGQYKNYGSVYDGDKQYEGANHSSSAQIEGFYEHKIYIKYEYAESLENVDEYGIPTFTALMFEYDPETDKIEQSDLPKDINFVNKGVYIYTENGKTVILDHGERKEIDVDGGSFVSYFNNKLFVRDSGKWYDLSDNSEHEMGEYTDHQVIDYYDGQYILMKHISTVMLTEDELFALG